MKSNGVRSSGLTLIEIVIALSILAVGVLAVAGLQTTGLRASRESQVLQRINATARAELDIWRASDITYTSRIDRSCVYTDSGCGVVVRPCTVGGGDLQCAAETVANPIAHVIEVTVADRNHELVLRTVVLR